MDDKREMSAAQLARILREARANGASMSEVIDRGFAIMQSRQESVAEKASSASLTLSTPPPPVVAQSTTSETQDGAQLRKMLAAMVHSGARWAQLQPIAWKLFMLAPADISAARLLELCALHGSKQDLMDLVKSIKDARYRPYTHLHPNVRERLAVIAWSGKRFELIADELIRLKDAPRLSGSERLVIFLFLASSNDPAQPFMYFKAHRAAILDAAKNYSGSPDMAFEPIVYRAAKLALELGFDFDVKDLGRLIPRTSDFYPGVVELLNQTLKSVPAGHADPLEIKMSEGTWVQRLDLLENRLDLARRNLSVRDPGRARLDAVLQSVTDFLPQLPEAWTRLSELLVLNRDLEVVQPSLMSVFRNNILVFHPRQLDAALWQGPLKIGSDLSCIKDSWWYGIALLHQYVASGSGHEETLWRSRKLILGVEADADFALPVRWADLLRAAVHHVSRHSSAGDPEKKIILAQLAVAGEADSFSAHDIESYLRASWRTPLLVLEELERIARLKKAPDVERLAIVKKASVAALTNSDLDAMWRSANRGQTDDLAWRIAGIVASRKCLVPGVLHALQISGERRSWFPFLSPQLPEVLSVITDGMSPRESTLTSALLMVGPKVASLMGIFDSRARLLKSVGHPSDSIEAAVDGALKNLTWLSGHGKILRFSHEQVAFGGLTLPPFVQVAPASAWGLLLVSLGQRLGFNGWNWQVSKLSAFASELIPRVAHIPEYKSQSAKVARWLRELTPAERQGWQEISREACGFSDVEGQDLVGKLLVRLSVMIHPDHLSALQSLQQMRAELPVIRDLEGWMLGAQYSEWRIKQGLVSRVMLPLNLRRTESICERRDLEND